MESKELQFPESKETMGIDANPFSNNVECSLVELSPCLQVVAKMTQATQMAIVVFNRLVNMEVLQFSYFDELELDHYCRWHVTTLHTTD